MEARRAAKMWLASRLDLMPTTTMKVGLLNLGCGVSELTNHKVQANNINFALAKNRKS
ncbi:hypothetical protein [Rhizobium sp. TRM95796]|uniref:hypothetical protein n=1 Tax=Rhizobium sp. TRM95796 TaxID=2979862 RepID=UPI0021E742AA|nr:hypothetical protein [Rhizobium sp. TRM95796]MCV3769114.1 hypothetical protein [Rhizobium sp. TRM95796]